MIIFVLGQEKVSKILETNGRPKNLSLSDARVNTLGSELSTLNDDDDGDDNADDDDDHDDDEEES